MFFCIQLDNILDTDQRAEPIFFLQFVDSFA